MSEEYGSNYNNVFNESNEQETQQQPQQLPQQGKYPWKLVLGAIAVAAIILFIFIRLGGSGGGEDIVGEYRHGTEYLNIESDGTATSEYKGVNFTYKWEKVRDGYYTFDTGQVKLDVEYYENSGCVTVNYTTGSVDYYPVD